MWRLQIPHTRVPLTLLSMCHTQRGKADSNGMSRLIDTSQLNATPAAPTAPTIHSGKTTIPSVSAVAEVLEAGSS